VIGSKVVVDDVEDETKVVWQPLETRRNKDAHVFKSGSTEDLSPVNTTHKESPFSTPIVSVETDKKKSWNPPRVRLYANDCVSNICGLYGYGRIFATSNVFPIKIETDHAVFIEYFWGANTVNVNVYNVLLYAGPTCCCITPSLTQPRMPFDLIKKSDDSVGATGLYIPAPPEKFHERPVGFG